MTSPRTSTTRIASLAVAGAVCLAALTGCSDDEPRNTASDPVGSPSTTEEPSPTEEATQAPETPEPTDGGLSVTVPLYFGGETPQGTRLYREFREVSARNPLQSAADVLTSGETLDPDYQGLFPQGEFTDVALTPDAIVATVPDDRWSARGDSMSQEQARLAVASLVYTLQGVAQERRPVVVQTADGTVLPLFGVSTPTNVRQRRELQTLALVNVTSPEQGSTVGGDTMKASGRASSFEANVPWQIFRGSELVLDGFATAEGSFDRLYPWETDIDVSGLEPGDYTFVAVTDDPSGGEGGGPVQDTKDFTIE